MLDALPRLVRQHGYLCQPGEDPRLNVAERRRPAACGRGRHECDPLDAAGEDIGVAERRSGARHVHGQLGRPANRERAFEGADRRIRLAAIELGNAQRVTGPLDRIQVSCRLCDGGGFARRGERGLEISHLGQAHREVAPRVRRGQDREAGVVVRPLSLERVESGTEQLVRRLIASESIEGATGVDVGRRASLKVVEPHGDVARTVGRRERAGMVSEKIEAIGEK